MTYQDPQVSVEWATRLCEVNGDIGYFHTWEQRSDVIEPSLMIGGSPGGQISKVFGIVEFDDRVTRVDPTHIKFIDGINAGLAIKNSRKGGEKKYKRSLYSRSV